jgi:hypothetical protein
MLGLSLIILKSFPEKRALQRIDNTVHSCFEL